MQRTLSGERPSIAASCLRRSCVAWDADHDVSLPSLNSAIAHDGPIEPWVWIGGPGGGGGVDGEVIGRLSELRPFLGQGFRHVPNVAGRVFLYHLGGAHVLP